MKTIKELLIILKEHTPKLLVTGLCLVVADLHYNKTITFDEATILYDYIVNNRPNKHSKQLGIIQPYYHWSYLGFYWKPGNLKPRLNWLDKHIAYNIL